MTEPEEKSPPTDIEDDLDPLTPEPKIDTSAPRESGKAATVTSADGVGPDDVYGVAAQPVGVGDQPPSAVPPPNDGEGEAASRTLSSLLTRSPGLDLFCKAAYRLHSHDDPSDRVFHHKEQHPVVYAICFLSDLTLRVFSGAILVLIAAAVFYKTIFPLPWPPLQP